MARILVVDDTPENLATIESYLRTEFDVVSAASGREAIELSRQQQFDLILLDVVMPGLDGFEVCRRMKDDARTAFVPVIFLTGRIGDESEKLAAYQLGAVDYIQKPVDRDELVARIRVMLRLEEARSRVNRENAALRKQLGKTEKRLADAAEALADLERLRAAWTAQPEPQVLVLGQAREVESFDPGIADWMPELRVGRRLADCGPAAARLALLVDGRVHGGNLIVAAPDGSERELAASSRRLGGSGLVVLLRDVTGVRAVERRIADHAVVVPPPRVEPSFAYRMTGYVGSAAAVAQLTERVAHLRQTRSTVLIYGESGTGKELVARALHFDGQNRSAPFIPLHCGAIAPELIESELFGHEKGAFTGAQQVRDGLFRAADGGTIFLDEIAETSPSVQVKLLRVLQRGEIRPVGANQPRIVDVRILAATNRDLAELVRLGKFREDLYWRLDVVTLQRPPLRERMEDLPALIDHFLLAGNRRHDLERPVRGVSRAAMERLMAYHWPGNVRELENVLERALALGAGEVLREEDLPPHVRETVPVLDPRPVRRSPSEPLPAVERIVDGSSAGIRAQLAAAERAAISQALRDNGGNKAATRRQLGMSRSTFYRRLRELGLSK